MKKYFISIFLVLTILMQLSAQAPNQSCLAAELLEVGIDCTPLFYSITDADDSGTYPICDTAGPNLDLWFSFVAPASGNIKIKFDDLQEEPEYAIWESCGASTGEEFICGTMESDTYNIPALAIGGLTPSTTYFLQIFHDENFVDDFEMCIREADAVPANATCEAAEEILVASSICEPVAFTTFLATDSGTHSACDFFGGDNNVNPDIWFTLITPPSGKIKFEIVAATGLPTLSGVKLEFAIWNACGGEVGEQVSCGMLEDNISLFLEASTQYLLQIWHDATKEDDFEMCIYDAEPLAINLTCDVAEVLIVAAEGTCSRITYSTFAIADSGVRPSCDSVGFNQDLWFSFTVPLSGLIGFDIVAQNLEYGIWEACGGGEIECGMLTNGLILYTLTPSTAYFLQIWHDSFNAGDFEMCIFDPVCALPIFDLSMDLSNCPTIDINVELMQLGTAASIMVSNDFNDSTAIATEMGTATLFGFSPADSKITVYAFSNTDSTCIDSASIIIPTFCPPTNETCETAEVIEIGNECEFILYSTVLATDSGIYGSCNVSNQFDGMQDLWFSFTAPASGKVKIREELGSVSSYTIWDACGGDTLLNEVFCDALFIEKTNILDLEPFQDYLLQIWHIPVNARDFELCLSEPAPPPTNISYQTATEIEINGEDCQTYCTYLSSDSGLHPFCDTLVNFDLWFTLVTPPSGNITFKIIQTQFLEYALWNSCDDISGDELQCGDLPDGLALALEPSTAYLLQVWHDDFRATDFKMYIHDTDGEPIGNVCGDCMNIMTSIDTTICQGENVNGHTTTGIFQDVFSASNACDSMLTLNLTVIATINNAVTAEICEGESFAGHTQTGVFEDTFTANSGCDSIRTLHLTVLENVSTEIIVEICEGESFDGHDETGIFEDIFTGSNGCDSIRILDLTVLENVSATISTEICEGESFEGHNETGIFEDIFIGTNGCDSLRILDLTVLEDVLSTITAEICEGENFEEHNETGIFEDTFTGVNGCDSIRTLNLTVLEVIITEITAEICEGESLGGHNETGIFEDTFTSSGGCDSIRTLNLTILENISTGISAEICEGESLSGHNETGIFEDIFTANNGCDSIRTLNLTVLEDILNTITAEICEGETLDGHSETGIFEDTFTGMNGCDSIRTLDLTVIPFLTITDTTIINDDSSNSGSISIQFSGGKAPFSFSWSNGETSQDINGLAVGEYQLIITDARDCSYIFTFIVDMIIATYDLTIENDLQIYPNPIHTERNMVIVNKGNKNLALAISIFNYLGQKEQHFDINITAKGNHQFIMQQKSGIYFLSIKQKEQLLNLFKIVVL